MTTTVSDGPERLRSGSPSLLPAEHGAYAQLVFPLATALLVTTPTAGGFGKR